MRKYYSLLIIIFICYSNYSFSQANSPITGTFENILTLKERGNHAFSKFAFEREKCKYAHILLTKNLEQLDYTTFPDSIRDIITNRSYNEIPVPLLVNSGVIDPNTVSKVHFCFDENIIAYRNTFYPPYSSTFLINYNSKRFDEYNYIQVSFDHFEIIKNSLNSFQSAFKQISSLYSSKFNASTDYSTISTMSIENMKANELILKFKLKAINIIDGSRADGKCQAGDLPSNFICELQLLTPDGNLLKTYHQSCTFWVFRAGNFNNTIIKTGERVMEGCNESHVYESIVKSLFNQFMNDTETINKIQSNLKEKAKIVQSYPETKQMFTLRDNLKANQEMQQSRTSFMFALQQQLLDNANDKTAIVFNALSYASTNSFLSNLDKMAATQQAKVQAADEAKLKKTLNENIDEINSLKEKEKEMTLELSKLTGNDEGYNYLLTENVRFEKFVEIRKKMTDEKLTTIHQNQASLNDFTNDIGKMVREAELKNNQTAGSKSSSTSDPNRDPKCVCYYKSGPHVDEVEKLLNAPGISGTFQYHSSMTKPDGHAPNNCPKNEHCMRDIYVCAAVAFAWTAEAYAYVGEQAKAEDAANQMHDQLKNADGMCSNKPGQDPGQDCQTKVIYPCH